MKTIVINIILLAWSCFANAQVIINGNFESSDDGWEDCIHEHGAEYLYGGTNLFNMVMAIHGGQSERDVLDDKTVCQTIGGFVPGRAYSLMLDASRMPNCIPAVNPMELNVSFDGAIDQKIALNANPSFQTFFCNFVATQTTHVLSITPDFTGACGAIVDNLAFLIVVPIELKYFDAKLSGNKVLINWETASEYNADYFVVERTDNGLDWSEIGRVNAAGIAQSVQYYKMEDEKAIDGMSYYRLKQVDIDGNDYYSDIKAVAWNRKDVAIELYPNPANKEIYVRMGDETKLDAILFDRLGQTIPIRYKRQALGIVINTKSLDEGVYFLQLSNEETVRVERFVVQH